MATIKPSKIARTRQSRREQAEAETETKGNNRRNNRGNKQETPEPKVEKQERL